MISGGGNRRRLLPLQPDGNLTPGRLGCHRGDYESLNVPNPQRGRHYYGFENTPRGRLMAQQRGYTLIRAGDPEYPGEFDAEGNLRLGGAGAETLFTFGSLVMGWCPEEKWAERRRATAERARAMQRGATQTFLDKGRSMTREGDLPVYHAGREGGRPHGIHEVDRTEID